MAPRPADTYAGYHPGASVGHVRATRASLPRWVRTGGAGRLAPRAARAVRTGNTYTPLVRTVPTEYGASTYCVPRTVARRLLRSASYHPQALHNDLLNRALKRGMKVGKP